MKTDGMLLVFPKKWMKLELLELIELQNYL